MKDHLAPECQSGELVAVSQQPKEEGEQKRYPKKPMSLRKRRRLRRQASCKET
jgi:hypothetical protein